MRAGVLLLLAVLAVLVGAVGGAVAQTPENGSQAAQDTPDTDDTNTTQIQDRLGQLVVHSYNYESGEMEIEATWRGDFPTEVTLTELIELDSAGSTDISFKRVRLSPDDRTEITVGVQKRGGTAAVLVTTPESVRNSSAVVLQSGTPDGQRDPVPFGLAALLAGGAGLVGAGGVFALVRRQRQTDNEDWYNPIA